MFLKTTIINLKSAKKIIKSHTLSKISTIAAHEQRTSELIKYVDLNWAKVLKWFRMNRTNGTTNMREENKEFYGRIDRGKETSYSLNGALRQRPKLDGGLSI